MGSPTNAAMLSSGPEVNTMPKRLREVFAHPSETHPLYRSTHPPATKTRLPHALTMIFCCSPAKPCRNFAIGHCSYGEKCAYIHIPLPKPQPTVLFPPSIFTSVQQPLSPCPPSPVSDQVAYVHPTLASFSFPTTSPTMSDTEDTFLPPVPPCTPACFASTLPSPVDGQAVSPLQVPGPTTSDSETQPRPRSRKRVRAATTSGTNHYRSEFIFMKQLRSDTDSSLKPNPAGSSSHLLVVSRAINATCEYQEPVVYNMTRSTNLPTSAACTILRFLGRPRQLGALGSYR